MQRLSLLAALAGRVCRAAGARVSVVGGSSPLRTLGTYGVELREDVWASLDEALLPAGRGRDQETVIEDARKDQRVATQPAVAGGPIVAYLSVPILAGDVLFGTVCVYDQAPRNWTEMQRSVLGDIAQEAAAVLHDLDVSQETEEALRWADAAKAHLALATETTDTSALMRSLVTSLDDLDEGAHAEAILWSDSAELELYSPSALPGSFPAYLTPPDVRRLAGSRPDGLSRYESGPLVPPFLPGRWVRLLNASGSMLVAPILGEDGPRGAVAVARPRSAPDSVPLRVHVAELLTVTANGLRRLDARRSQLNAQARLAFLAAVSLELEFSLEVEETFLRTSRMMVPAVADACLIYLDGDEGVRLVAGAHLDAAKERTLKAHAAHCPALLRGARESARKGGSWLAGVACTCVGSGLDDLPGGRLTGVVAALRARGRTLGAIWLARDPRGAAAEMLEPDFVDDLARRVAIAVDNALLHQQRRDTVVALQRRLLPPDLPEMPGFDLAASYEVADVSLDVGGDFYDVIRRPDDGFALVIGDVCGRGADAASMTGLARHTLRVLLEEGWSPQDALQRLNASIRRDRQTLQFCTALVVDVRPVREGARATVVSAGHPLPLRIPARGGEPDVDEVGRPGQLLGIFETIVTHPAEVTLAPGDTLFLFTDGVTEARGATGFYEPRLPAELAASRGSSAAGTVAAVRHAVSAYRRSAADDVAMLALRVRGRELLRRELPPGVDRPRQAYEALRELWPALEPAAEPPPARQIGQAVLELVRRASSTRRPVLLGVYQQGARLRAEVSTVFERGKTRLRVSEPSGDPEGDGGPRAAAQVAERSSSGADLGGVAWVEVDFNDE